MVVDCSGAEPGREGKLPAIVEATAGLSPGFAGRVREAAEYNCGMAKKKKIRVDMRKNLAKPPRDNRWTRDFQAHGFAEEDTTSDERVRSKGDLSRKRTIIQDESQIAGEPGGERPSATAAGCERGRVLKVQGLFSAVQAADGRVVRCAVRRLLKSMVTDERNVVTTGDWVWFRPSAGDEGMIETVEPRRGVLTRASRKREHVLVANVDQVVIVMSLFEPDLKPHLIDRYLACAQRGGLQPIVCLNKADLARPAGFIPLVGAFAQLGVPVLLTSAVTGQGVDRLKEMLVGKATVFSGQSGVGKSSLLNAIQPDLGLRVHEVSEATEKGQHTTTTAELIPLNVGGWAVDTPGVRQFQLWNIRPEEVEGFFPEMRPFVALCAFPDCTHTHEERCAVKRAVDRKQISGRRYHSYLGMRESAQEEREER
jgi:ribosome biogenesis GTPase / thiamine phosphate phosphatase